MKRPTFSAAICLAVAGCSMLPGRSPPTAPAPASAPSPPSVETVETVIAEVVPPEPVPPAPALEPPSTITRALVEEAGILVNAGSPSEAAAAIEQAIRIEPRRGELWLQLAMLRLRDGQVSMAEQSARKALLFLAAGSAAERDAWLVVADAREAQGDLESAEGIRSRWNE